MDEALSFLYSIGRFKINLGLDRITRALAELGNPHQGIRYVHIAGTNGKGSICAFLMSILKEAGLKVGMYTSPHLLDFRERFQINGKLISEKDVTRLTDKVKPLVSRFNLTFFETITLMAFLYFSEQKVDIVVLEVGMGGRLDATNVITPLVSVISNISLEHTEHLGSTIEKIAREKAGVIKENSVVVTQATGDALEVIHAIALEKNAKVLIADKLPDFKLSMLGEFQKRNAAIAIRVAEELSEQYKISRKIIVDGVKKAKWPGRFQMMGKILLDCAHNPEAIQCLVSEVRGLKFNRLITVVGILSDKDHKLMVEELSSISDFIVFTRSEILRAFPPEELAKLTEIDNAVFNNVGTALNFALNKVGKDDMILVTGSIYVVGEAMAALKKQNRI